MYYHLILWRTSQLHWISITVTTCAPKRSFWQQNAGIVIAKCLEWQSTWALTACRSRLGSHNLLPKSRNSWRVQSCSSHWIHKASQAQPKTWSALRWEKLRPCQDQATTPCEGQFQLGFKHGGPGQGHAPWSECRGGGLTVVDSQNLNGQIGEHAEILHC